MDKTNRFDFKIYVARSMRMSGYLMQRGFRLRSIGPCFDMPNKDVYYFKNSPELLEAVKDYKETKMKEGNKNAKLSGIQC